MKNVLLLTVVFLLVPDISFGAGVQQVEEQDLFPQRCELEEIEWTRHIQWSYDNVSNSCSRFGTWDDLSDKEKQQIYNLMMQHCREKVIGGYEKAIKDLYDSVTKQKISSPEEFAARTVDFLNGLWGLVGDGTIAVSAAVDTAKNAVTCLVRGSIEYIPSNESPEDIKAVLDSIDAVSGLFSAEEITQNYMNGIYALFGKLKKGHKRSSLYNFFANRTTSRGLELGKDIAVLKGGIESCKLEPHNIQTLKDKVFANANELLQRARDHESYARQRISCYIDRRKYLDKSEHKYRTIEYGSKEDQEIMQEYLSFYRDANKRQCDLVENIRGYYRTFEKAEEKNSERQKILGQLQTKRQLYTGHLRNCRTDKALAVLNEMKQLSSHECLWDFTDEGLDKYHGTLASPTSEEIREVSRIFAGIERNLDSCDTSYDSKEMDSHFEYLRDLKTKTEWICRKDLTEVKILALEKHYKLVDEQRKDFDRIKGMTGGVRERLRPNCLIQQVTEDLNEAERQFNDLTLTQGCQEKYESFPRRIKRLRKMTEKLSIAVSEYETRSLDSHKRKLDSFEEQLEGILALQEGEQCRNLEEFISGMAPWLKVQLFYTPLKLTANSCSPRPEEADEIEARASALKERAENILGGSGTGDFITNARNMLGKCRIDEFNSALNKFEIPGGMCSEEAEAQVDALKRERDALERELSGFEDRVMLMHAQGEQAFAVCDFANINGVDPQPACLIDALTPEGIKKVQEIDRLKSDALDVNSAVAKLERATQEAPEIIQLCRYKGALTDLEFWRAASHANFLMTFKESCINNHPAVQFYMSVKNELERRNNEITAKREKLRGKLDLAKRKKEVPMKWEGEMSPEQAALLQSSFSEGNEILAEIEAEADPGECFEDLLSEIMMTRVKVIPSDVAAKIAASGEDDEEPEEEKKEDGKEMPEQEASEWGKGQSHDEQDSDAWGVVTETEETVVEEKEEVPDRNSEEWEKWKREKDEAARRARRNVDRSRDAASSSPKRSDNSLRDAMMGIIKNTAKIKSQKSSGSRRGADEVLKDIYSNMPDNKDPTNPVTRSGTGKTIQKKESVPLSRQQRKGSVPPSGQRSSPTGGEGVGEFPVDSPAGGSTW